MDIGSKEWWCYTDLGGARGLIDSILRLAEQEEISRAKARELLEFAVEVEVVRYAAAGWEKYVKDPPSAPWDKLNFYERSSDGVV